MEIYARNKEIDKIRTNVEELLQAGTATAALELCALLDKQKELIKFDSDLAILWYLSYVVKKELADNVDIEATSDTGKTLSEAIINRPKSLFEKCNSISQITYRFTTLKFLLRRLEYDVFDESVSVITELLSANQVSAFELMGIIDSACVDKQKVLDLLSGKRQLSNALDNNGAIDTYADANSDVTNTDNLLNNSLSNTTAKMPFIPCTYDKEGINPYGICFIMCTNNMDFMQEAMHYISHLRIPEGYSIDFLGVEDAKSMTSGYNEAMNSSNAKYKIYMHQDTFLINPNMLYEMLEIFINNKNIGMMGCFGPTDMPEDGCMWSVDRYGSLYESHVFETKHLFKEITGKFLPVACVDGFLIMTQYDITWREDVFKRWDFYDTSQSMEFKLAGLDIAVPNMSTPWALHDCGYLNMDRYETERELFLRTYLPL